MNDRAIGSLRRRHGREKGCGLRGRSRMDNLMISSSRYEYSVLFHNFNLTAKPLGCQVVNQNNCRAGGPPLIAAENSNSRSIRSGCCPYWPFDFT